MDVSKFESVSTLIFARLTEPLTFDVYLQLSDDKFTKIFHKDSSIDSVRLENYVLRGITYFYILKEEREEFMRTTSKLLERYAKAHDFIKEEAQHILDETSEKVLAEIMAQTKLSKENLKHSKIVIQSYVEITSTHSEALPNLLRLAKTKKNILRHSIMTSIFSTLLARGLRPEDDKFSFNAGLAAFLHDIGMTLSSDDLNEHNKKLTGELKRIVHEHPKESVRILKDASLEDDVRLAILYHHENWDGTGYPSGIKKRDIPILARVLAVADNFSSLINSTSESPSLSPQMAFAALQKSGKLDPEVCMVFGKILNLG